MPGYSEYSRLPSELLDLQPYLQFHRINPVNNFFFDEDPFYSNTNNYLEDGSYIHKFTTDPIDVTDMTWILARIRLRIENVVNEARAKVTDSSNNNLGYYIHDTRLYETNIYNGSETFNYFDLYIYVFNLTGSQAFKYWLGSSGTYDAQSTNHYFYAQFIGG